MDASRPLKTPLDLDLDLDRTRVALRVMALTSHRSHTDITLISHWHRPRSRARRLACDGTDITPITH